MTEITRWNTMMVRQLKIYVPVFLVTTIVSATNPTCVKATENILENFQKEITKLIEVSKPSVVSVSSLASYSFYLSSSSSIFSFLERKREKKTVYYRNVGSGLIFNKEGYIITKSSVILDPETIEVTLFNNKTYPATFIGSDAEMGLAVIKIEEENLKPACLGNSEEVKVGCWIIIIGNSLGVSPSVSLGLVNGIREKDGLFQLSASVTPGNSGSPVFNSDGQVIGLVTAQVDACDGSFWTSRFSQSSLAYPINKIHETTERIIKNCHLKRGWLGVRANGQLKPEITQILEKSPAYYAGLRPGDIIVKYENQEVSSSYQLQKLIEQTQPGGQVKLTVRRNDEEVELKVTVGEKPPYDPFVTRSATQPPFYPYPVNETDHSEVVFPINLQEMNQLRERVQVLEMEVRQLRGILQEKH